MKQQKDRNWELIVKHLSQELDSREKEELSLWLSSSDSNKNELNTAQKIWKNSSFDADRFDTNKGWRKMRNRIHKTISPASESHEFKSVFVRIAASLLILASLGFFIYQLIGRSQFITIVAENQKILSPVILPDGSKVYLNLGASLRFPKKFASASRTIELDGEAYFDVVHNAHQPFVIQTAKAKIKVLGTSFNVLADAKGDSVQVVVETGIVQLSSKNDDNNITVTKGNTGSYYTNTKKLIKSDKSDINALAWKTNVIVFHDADLLYITKTLSKLFLKPIRLENDNLKNCRLNSDFKHENLDSILKTVQELLHVDIQKSREGYLISGKGC